MCTGRIFAEGSYLILAAGFCPNTFGNLLGRGFGGTVQCSAVRFVRPMTCVGGD